MSTIALSPIIDTIRMIDKYNLAYTFDEANDRYFVNEDDFNRMLEHAVNKKYILNLRAGVGRLKSHNY